MVAASGQIVVQDGTQALAYPSLHEAMQEAVARHSMAARSNAEALAKYGHLGKFLIGLHAHVPYGRWRITLRSHGIHYKRADAAIDVAQAEVAGTLPGIVERVKARRALEKRQKEGECTPPVSDIAREIRRANGCQKSWEKKVTTDQSDGTPSGRAKPGWEIANDDDEVEGIDRSMLGLDIDEVVSGHGADGLTDTAMPRFTGPAASNGAALLAGGQGIRRAPVKPLVGKQLGLAAMYELADGLRALLAEMHSQGGDVWDRTVAMVADLMQGLTAMRKGA